MGSRRTRRLLLLAAATDRTFVERSIDGEPVLVGRCIHCQSRLLVPIDSARPTSATLEHIVPRTHGGKDAVENLAVACPRCNAGKGMRLDVRAASDPTLMRVVEALVERRRARLRDPIVAVSLPPPDPPAPGRRRAR